MIDKEQLKEAIRFYDDACGEYTLENLKDKLESLRRVVHRILIALEEDYDG